MQFSCAASSGPTWARGRCRVSCNCVLGSWSLFLAHPWAATPTASPAQTHPTEFYDSLAAGSGGRPSRPGRCLRAGELPVPLATRL